VERIGSESARAEAVATTARLNHRRAVELLGRQMIAQESMDKALEQLRTAEADVRRVQAAIIEAQAQVVTAEKTLAYHRQRLEYTQITSPYDGLVVRRDRDPGGVVVPGGSLLLVIATNELWVSAWVNETAAAALRTGQTARVVFRSDVRDAAGSVVRLGRETDRETREFVVDVRVEELPPNWTVGQRAEVYIETGREADAVRVPPGFVAWRGRAPGVFVEEGGEARWRAVGLGRPGRRHIKVTQGLEPGERVVRPADGTPKPLKDGQRVRTGERGEAS
jgi:RND family efflux transporter MFP subunit